MNAAARSTALVLIRDHGGLALLAALAALAAAPLAAQTEPYAAAGGSAYADSRSQPVDDSRESYSYVRAIEGRASLASYGNGPGEEADLNQILQQGDRLRVEQGGRIEVYLADRNLVRVGGDSDLGLTRVAFSADRDDRTTLLDLERGEIVLVVTDDALGDELPEIRTPSARVYVNEPGTYRIRTDEGAYTEVVVRSGYAELLTEGGSTVVRAGEEAWTSGDGRRPVEVADAGPRDALERWGEELIERAQAASEETSYVEPELSYAAAPLADYGSWVNVDASWYWRPRVSFGWRPYWQGRWCWSPSGLTWVSSEPWGWVPYHYGTWCNLPGYGWAWSPGRVYSPAWVYWYASDSWTGWCPIGYYTNYYRSYWDLGFRWGIYGWCGGSWSFFNDWNFCHTRRICDRRWGGGWSTGVAVARESGNQGPNGILTTDTGGLPRDEWDRPGDLVRTLERKGRAARRGGDLPVVTDFVARKKDLPPAVANAVRREPSDRPGLRLGSPLEPGARGKGGAVGRGRSAVAQEERPGWRIGPKSDGRIGQRDDDARGRSSDARGGGRSSAPSAEPGTRGRRIDAPAPAPSDRQGWKSGAGQPLAPPRGRVVEPTERARPTPPPTRRESSSPPTYRGSDARGNATQPRYGYPARDLGLEPAAPPARSAQPVERVIGGVRRGESQAPSRSAPPSYGYRPPTSNASPRTGSQPSRAPSAPTVRAAPAAPRTTAPAPRSSGPSAGYAAPRPSAAPTQRAAPAPRSSGQSGGQRATHSTRGSSQGSSSSKSNQSSQSSPPPQKQRGHGGD